MVDLPNAKNAYELLEARAEYAAAKACSMMTNGSREYERIKQYVEEFMKFRYAADRVSGQTDSSLGELDG